MTAPSRRQLLLGGAAVAAGAAAGQAVRIAVDAPDAGGSARAEPTHRDDRTTVATGPTQAGVDRPVEPPTHLHLHALAAPSAVRTSRSELARVLAALGRRVLDEVDRGTADGDDLTLQVGIGADLLALSGLPEAPDVALPAFTGTAELAPGRRGGDLFLLVASARPEQASAAIDALLAALPDFEPRWSQVGFRPRGDGPVTRNPFGYEDGIVQPALSDGVPEHVWLQDGPFAGSTVGVVRRFALDVAGFRRLADVEQDRVFGRERASGAPLSGGGPREDVNLGAKSPSGAYLVPADAHARAAHPSFTDATVMLRRSYGFRESVDGAAERSGLLFLSYQDDLSVFTRTQQRMDRGDRLMDFATPTAEAAFLVLPGFDRDTPLGTGLFG